MRNRFAAAEAIEDLDDRNKEFLDIYIDYQLNGDKKKYKEFLDITRDSLRKKIEEMPNKKGLVYDKIARRLEIIDSKGYDFTTLNSFINRVRGDVNSGGKIDEYKTERAAVDKVEKSDKLKKQYSQWLDSLDERYEVKEVIFK